MEDSRLRLDRKPSLLGLLLTLGLIAALVAAAGAQAAAPRPHPTSKAKGINALIVGGAGSPVLNAIRADRQGRFNVDSTSAPAGSDAAPLRDRDRYEVLIVDGDNLPPRKMERLPAIRRFADSGRWVLAFDLRHGRFRRAIRSLTGFGGASSSRVFMFRRTTVDGSPQVQMVASPRILPSGAADLARAEQRRLERIESTRLAALVHDTVSSDGENLTENKTETSPADAGLPAELQHVGWSYTVTGSMNPPKGYWWTGGEHKIPILVVPDEGHQTSTWSMTHNFNVYLDNGQGKPQGNDEIVTYELNGEFSPKEPHDSFFQMFNPFNVGFNANGPILERAWWTGMVGSSVVPTNGTGDKLTWQASEPQTPNEETEYSSGEDFEIGFSGSKDGAAVDASYKISNAQTRKIPDWGVENETSGNTLAWLFSTRKGCDPRPEHYSDSQCFNVGFNKDGAPNLPPDLSRGQIQVHTSGRWKTKGLLTPGNGELSFDVATPITLADTYCEQWNWGDVACVRRDIRRQQTGPATQHYSFDAAAVAPISVEAVKLAPNPANGAKSQEVTGSVVLKRPAAMDTNVIIYSDSPNAVVGGPSGRGSQRAITIPKGSTTGTFKVQTNDNNLAPGGHTSASITAFYAEPTTVQLKIESPAGESPAG